jgi:hypothetical protein
VHDVDVFFQEMPYDCHTLLPIDMPIGGALVFAANVVIHYKQKIEYVLSVNEFGDASKEFRVSPVPSSCHPICLDRSRSAFIAPDQILIGLATGDLYIMSISPLGDSIRKYIYI